MHGCDWSSDVCSSDLPAVAPLRRAASSRGHLLPAAPSATPAASLPSTVGRSPRLLRVASCCYALLYRWYAAAPCPRHRCGQTWQRDCQWSTRKRWRRRCGEAKGLGWCQLAVVEVIMREGAGAEGEVTIGKNRKKIITRRSHSKKMLISMEG